MGKGTTITLTVAVYMLACMYARVSGTPPQSVSQPTRVILFGANGGLPDDMTEDNVKNLLKRNALADAKDIQEITFLRNARMAIVTLFNPKVAAKISERSTIKYNGQSLYFELDSVMDEISDLLL
jgi:hypothetical protein